MIVYSVKFVTNTLLMVYKICVSSSELSLGKHNEIVWVLFFIFIWMNLSTYFSMYCIEMLVRILKFIEISINKLLHNEFAILK